MTSHLSPLFFFFSHALLTAFGGPAMVAYMRDMAVIRYRWLDEETFREGLQQNIHGRIAFEQVTPVPIVITSTFIGYLTHGLAGAFVATSRYLPPLS